VTSAGRIGWGGAALLWAGLVTYGFGLWNAYELRPGEIPDPTVVSVSSRSPTGSWRVMMFVHPHCPCSQASVQELRRVLQELARVAPEESVQASILIVRPPEAPTGWEHGEILREVQRWNEVSVTVDQGGETARQWAVATSGHVIVLDPQGRVRFRGGITSGRGRQGNSLGSQRIVQMIREASHGAKIDDARVSGIEGKEAPSESGDPVFTTPVYGCPLWTPGGEMNGGVLAEEPKQAR
jgi:hypothetical protein